MDKSGVMQIPEEVKERAQNMLKIEVTSIDPYFPPSPVPHSVVPHEGRESAGALVRTLDVCSEEMSFCLHGGERSLEKKPGTDQLGFG